MLSDPKRDTILDDVADQLRQATTPAPGLLREVIARACIRLEAMRCAGKAKDLDRLIEDGAWCDAALALIELELPAWSVRRLVREDGEWFCSLSREPNLPAALDDTADASHPVLPLAILVAFVEARRRSIASQGTGRSPVPAVRPAYAGTICCDNFS